MAAYVTAILSATYEVNVWISAIIAVIVIGVVSFLLALVVFRTYGHFFAILTLVMSLVLYDLYCNLTITNGTIGISGVPSLFPVSWPALTFYYFVLFIMLVSIAFVIWLRKTRLGYSMKGIGANEKLAASVGISHYSYKTAALVISSLFAAVAGVLYAYFMTYVSPAPFGITASLSMLIAVVIGGTGTVLGPILGSILLVFLPAYLQSFQDYQLTIYGLACILIIRFMPRGLVSIGDYLKPRKTNVKMKQKTM